jgi:hypothetical protein
MIFNANAPLAKNHPFIDPKKRYTKNKNKILTRVIILIQKVNFVNLCRVFYKKINRKNRQKVQF